MTEFHGIFLLLNFVIFSLSFSTCYAANIVYMSILASPSHHIWNSALSNGLAKIGHNITIISPYSEPNPPSGVHYILLESHDQTVNEEYAKNILKATEIVNPICDAFAIQETYVGMCSDAIKTNGFKTLVNYPDNFKVDLIIHDFVVGSCFLPFLHKFNYPPLLAVTAFGHPPFLNPLIGGHYYSSYVPHFSTIFDGKMTIMQRVSNFILHVEEFMLFKYYLNPKIDAMVSEYFGPNLPSVTDLEQRTALAFVNTNPAMDYLIPLPENVIPVGGLHIKEPKPLSQDLKKFIDAAKKGAVVVSFGSNYRSDFMPQEKQKILLDAFRQLNDYHFIWKFESNMSSADLPKNIQIHAWLPLSDILADSNVKAIIFHGGLLTTHEAIYRSTPMIIMPFALDQRQNLIKTERLGIAKGLNYLSLNVKETTETILNVLEDPSYATNALKWSARFRDQKEKPLDRAIWWIEWLLRNPNCEYLKSPVLRLGFIAGNTYDVIAFIALITALFLISFLIIFYNCLKNCTNCSHHKKVTNKIKNK